MADAQKIPIDKKFLQGQGFPFISKPTTISEYAVTRDRNVEIGRMHAKNLYDTPLHSKPNSFSYNLDAGYETFDPKEGDEKLDVLLKWIRKMAPNGGKLKKAVHEADVVCWRGLLTRIGTTVYDSEESWRFKAIRNRGVVFLCEEETEQKKLRKANTTEREKHMTYWGHKFEQYVTVEDNQEVPDTSAPVSTREEFASVVRTSIQNSCSSVPKKTIELLYSAEIDCLDRDGKYMELKTHKGELQGWFWTGTKSLKWWLQSFLVAIERLVVGHRDNEGNVRKVTVIRNDEIQKHAQWYGGACIRFISIILSNVYQVLNEDGRACVVEFNGNGSNGVEIRKIAPNNCEFLPSDFLKDFY